MDIKAAKIDELKNLGIEGKYLYELQKKTVSFWVIHAKYYKFR